MNIIKLLLGYEMCLIYSKNRWTDFRPSSSSDLWDVVPTYGGTYNFFEATSERPIDSYEQRLFHVRNTLRWLDIHALREINFLKFCMPL